METDGNPESLNMHSALVMINLKVLQTSIFTLTDESVDVFFSLLHLNAVCGFSFCMNRTIYIIFIKTLCCAKCIIRQKQIVLVFILFF